MESYDRQKNYLREDLNLYSQTFRVYLKGLQLSVHIKWNRGILPSKDISTRSKNDITADRKRSN